MKREAVIIQTGTANTASVMAGIARAGGRPVLSNDRRRIEDADRVVLPGVGALAAAMDRLQRDGLTDVIMQRVAAGLPTLAICLGLQLLCRKSEESPGAMGLGVLGTDVRRFSGSVQIPQMGWNLVTAGEGCRYLESGFAYFANSYRVTIAPRSWRTAWADHGGPFVAAFEKGDVLACQFHPELSGDWGEALLTRWLQGGGSC